MHHIKRYISLFLLVVVSVFIVPKELIHSFVDHKDSEHEFLFPDAPVSLDHEHTHCEFLKLNVPLYHSDYIFFEVVLPVSYFVFETFGVQHSLVSSFQLPALRGPPAYFSTK